MEKTAFKLGKFRVEITEGRIQPYCVWENGRPVYFCATQDQLSKFVHYHYRAYDNGVASQPA